MLLKGWSRKRRLAMSNEARNRVIMCSSDPFPVKWLFLWSYKCADVRLREDFSKLEGAKKEIDTLYGDLTTLLADKPNDMLVSYRG